MGVPPVLAVPRGFDRYPDRTSKSEALFRSPSSKTTALPLSRP